MVKNFCIIGAGWYGCHIGLYLKELGHNVVIYEKEKKIFNGASGFNQFRLHKGFHYPRSIKTTIECKKGYEYFEKNYKKFLKKTNSFYCIEKKSKVSYKNYTKFFKKKKLKFKEVKKNHFIKTVPTIAGTHFL